MNIRALCLLALSGACSETASSNTPTSDASHADVILDAPADAPVVADIATDARRDVTVEAAADVMADVSPDLVTDAPMCPLPALEAAACAGDDECAMVSRGCYCGEQPVEGVNRRFEAAAGVCEAAASRNCLLGCANFPGHRAEDGRIVGDGGMIAVRCERDAGVGRCRTFVR